MIDINKIKTVLFSGMGQQIKFIRATNACSEPIEGHNFDEKLTYLLCSASEETLQLILAPFLREQVYQHLSSAETQFVQKTKKRSIKIEGESLYLAQFSDNGQTNTPEHQDFLNIYHTFVKEIGTQIWDKLVQQASTCSDDLEDTRSFHDQKNAFLAQFPSADQPDYWDRIHKPSDAERTFHTTKRHILQCIGPELWAQYTQNDTDNHSFSLVIADEETTLSLPLPPEPQTIYQEHKNNFVTQFGLETWNQMLKSPIPEEAVQAAQTIKQEQLTQYGKKQWNRIYCVDSSIKYFDEIKSIFNNKWGMGAWSEYSAAEPTPDLDPKIMTDFLGYKKQYITDGPGKTEPNAWERARAFPPVAQESLTLLEGLRDGFVTKWGQLSWQNYLNSHRADEYATDVQLIAIAELFDLRLEVTDIKDGIQRTTMTLRGEGTQTIHFYCQDNTHYYIHEDGYYETLGVKNNCAYSGAIQWLKLLYLGQEPRRIRLWKRAFDSELYICIQHTINPETTLDSFVIPEAEEVTLDSIRKVLGLNLSISTPLLAKFIQTQAQDLIALIKLKRLPHNRMEIIKKIAMLSDDFSKNNQKDNLVVLQSILLKITNTVYLPNTRDAVGEWTRCDYEANLAELRGTALVPLSSHIFHDLADNILNTDFSNKNPENCLLEPMFTPISQTPASTHTTISCSSKDKNGDCLSATLYISGIFIMLAAISSLVSLLVMSFVMGPTALGILLMQNGMAGLAQNVATVMTLSLPTSAVLIATTTTSILGSFGYTLFKEFTPSAFTVPSFSFGLS